MDRFLKSKDEKKNCIKFNNYRKCKVSKITYIFDKTSVLSIICNKCGSIDEKIFTEEGLTETIKILGLINNMKM